MQMARLTYWNKDFKIRSQTLMCKKHLKQSEGKLKKKFLSIYKGVLGKCKQKEGCDLNIKKTEIRAKLIKHLFC